VSIPFTQNKTHCCTARLDGMKGCYGASSPLSLQILGLAPFL